ncbi:DUF2254 family protein [Bradyrhizobium sp. 1(2017)]|uniref:DUF2254 family protein n=1 Tax=Bradyrhizobium sp. 1(2017) TaxID=1404888 RepID=UPI0039C8ABFC
MDQIEDMLRRLIRKDLDTAHIRDSRGELRVILLLPSWEDYLSLAFDEIRQFGGNSIQVVRRLRSALSGLADISPTAARTGATRRYLSSNSIWVSIIRSLIPKTNRKPCKKTGRDLDCHAGLILAAIKPLRCEAGQAYLRVATHPPADTPARSHVPTEVAFRPTRPGCCTGNWRMFLWG